MNTSTSQHLAEITRQDVKSSEVLGCICWWNTRGIDILRDDFVKMLRKVGLSEDFAPVHNYRSAFIRAINNLKERRIIRKVEEDAGRLIYQFTSETKIDDPDDPELVYNAETLIKIDKDAYYTFGEFAKAIECDKEMYKEPIVRLFEEAKERYTSSDITRYTQNIFKSNADIISLREQGSVYFVPKAFKPVIDKVDTLYKMLSENYTANFDYMPIVDINRTRKTVGKAVNTEILDHIKDIHGEVKEAIMYNKEYTSKWVEHRHDTLKKIEQRAKRYRELIDLPMILDKVRAVSNSLNSVRLKG